MTAPFLSPTSGGVRIRIRVQPRARHDRIVGRHGDQLKAQVTAPPVDGAANAALERLVAEVVDVPPSSVRVVSGATCRDKVVEVANADVAALTTRIERLAGR